MDSNYAANYRQLYQNHWWWRAREEAVLRVIRQQCQPHSQKRILDVGCGKMMWLTLLLHSAGARVVVDGVAYAPHRAMDVTAWDVCWAWIRAF